MDITEQEISPVFRYYVIIAMGDAPAAGRSPGSIRFSSGILFSRKNFDGVPTPQASAATESAQVSTFVRIASSEYEVRLTWLRLNVSM